MCVVSCLARKQRAGKENYRIDGFGILTGYDVVFSFLFYVRRLKSTEQQLETSYFPPVYNLI